MKRAIYIMVILLLVIGIIGCEKKVDDIQHTTKQVIDKESWSFHYPASWDRVEDSYIQESKTGKTIIFESTPCTREELEEWIQSEIYRKLNAQEADNSLQEALSIQYEEGIVIYQYTVKSKMEKSEVLLKTTIFHDGKKRYEFRGTIPPLSEEEYEDIIQSFQLDQEKK